MRWNQTLRIALIAAAIAALAGCGEKIGTHGQQQGYATRNDVGQASDLNDADEGEDAELAADEDEGKATKHKSGKTASNKKALVKDKAEAVPPALEDCKVVALHEGHAQCDDGDLAAQAAHEDQLGDQAAAPSVPESADATPAPATPDDTVAEQPAAPPAEQPATPAEPPKDPNIVEFRIKAGTGAQPWNTMAEVVVAKVGQTVRIFNDDTVDHRLHTNGAPCGHQAGVTAPGESFDCVVTRALDPVARPGQTYDHIAGNSAVFFLMATP